LRPIPTSRSISAEDHPTKPSILLADDDAAFRKALEKFLGPHYTIAGSVGDGLALVEAARVFDPDLIIADISMPVLNGIQAVRQIMSSQPNARVIFLTVHEEPAFVLESQKTGALGYLLKRSLTDQLMPAIREVLHGDPFVCPECAITPALRADLHELLENDSL